MSFWCVSWLGLDPNSSGFNLPKFELWKPKLTSSEPNLIFFFVAWWVQASLHKGGGGEDLWSVGFNGGRSKGRQRGGDEVDDRWLDVYLWWTRGKLVGYGCCWLWRWKKLMMLLFYRKQREGRSSGFLRWGRKSRGFGFWLWMFYGGGLFGFSDGGRKEQRKKKRNRLGTFFWED